MHYGCHGHLHELFHKLDQQTNRYLEEMPSCAHPARSASSASSDATTPAVAALTIDEVLTLVDDPEMTPTKAKLLEQDPDNKLREFRDLAQQKTYEQVKLLLQGDTSKEIAQSIAGTAAGQVYGEPGRYTMIVYQPTHAGEAATHPHLRIAPLRTEHIIKQTRGALMARRHDTTLTDDIEIHPGDAYVMFDGCRHGNELQLQAGFKNALGKRLQSNRHQLYLCYSESSLKSRRDRVKTTLDCVEYAHILTKESIVIAEQDRVHLEGQTTIGNFMGPLPLPAHSDMWRVKAKRKKAMYGSFKFDVGGSTPGVTGTVARSDDDEEPVCFHGLSKVVYAEMTHMLRATAVWNLTTCDDVLAEHCIENKIPYLGFVYTEEHKQELYTRLVARTFALMQEEGNNLYEPGLVKILGNSYQQIAKDDQGYAKRRILSRKRVNPRQPRKARGEVVGRNKQKTAFQGGADAKSTKAKLLEKLKKMQEADEESDEFDENEGEESETEPESDDGDDAN